MNETAIFVPHNDTNTTGLDKRANVRDCLSTFANVAGAFGGVAGAGAAWYTAFHSSVPGEIVYRLDRSECGIVSHDVCKKGHKCIKYIYTASGSCKTTAEERTIRGGLEAAWNQYIKYNYNGVWCLNLSHKGNWKGYLLIGPNANWGNIACGENDTGSCVSGGANTVWHQ